MRKISRLLKKIIPCPGYVILEILEHEDSLGVTLAGVEKASQKGKVLKVGKHTYLESGQRIDCPVKVGDVVVHSGFGYEDFYMETKLYRVCPFNKILVVL